jgi:predicted signal transduction protein with EAL and GGDEF domain
MHHFLATPRAMAAVATKARWRRNATALSGAKFLLILTTVAAFLLAATVLGAVVYAVGKIDEAAIADEMSRARIALSTIDPDSSEAEIGSILANTFVLADAHFGDGSQLAEGQVAISVAGHERALIWSPNRIGSRLFAHLAPLRLGASGVFLVGIVFLMRRLYRIAHELEARRAEAQELAARDALTGLGNRLAFDQGIAQMLEQGRGDVALLYLDLDGFKQVNDTFGHGAGGRRTPHG